MTTTDTHPRPTGGLSETGPFDPSLRRMLAKNWWLFLLRGVAAIVFGVLALIWPAITLVTLVLLYGAFAFADGILALIAGITGKTGRNSRWWLILFGILGIAAGILTVIWPGITALMLLFFIAFWAIAGGIFQIVGAIRLRKEIDNEWWLVLGGALSVLFGLALLILPGPGALALVWLIGSFAVAYGITLVIFAFRMRQRG
jgi:uncharacterized membrane protein HdeD (DUF308 family)